MTTKSIKKGKGEKRIVKAWCIVDKHNGEIEYSGSIVLVDRFETKRRGLHKDFLSIPCTISYTTPAKQVTKRRVK